MKTISRDDDRLSIRVTQLPISRRAMSCLLCTNIATVGDLVVKTRKNLLWIPNMGAKSANLVEDALAVIDLSLRMKIIEPSE